MQVEFPAIEVAGETNPLTEGILYNVLRSASSSDPQQIQTGTKQLQEWEKRRGFYPLLQVTNGSSHVDCKKTDRFADRLPDQVTPTRSPLPRHYPAQEWH
jgi:hypothetical protein